MRKTGLTKNLIIDTDMGWDDLLAILLLLKNPNYNILGITVTGCGETHLNEGVDLALRLLTLGDLPNVPVCKGANKPGQYNHQFPPSFRNMMDDACGLKNSLPEPMGTIDKRMAWDFINDMLTEQENQITILSLGGLTNIDQLLKIKPKAKIENIERIVVMGGAINVDGNVASLNNSKPEWDQGSEYSTKTYAEWNIFLDPQAAKNTFNSEIPIKLVPLDTCDYAILDERYIDLITAQDKVAIFAQHLIKEKVAGPAKENIPLPVFDPLAAIVMTNDILNIYTTRKRIAVKTEEYSEDNTCGKTYVTHDKNIPHMEVTGAISTNDFKNAFQENINSPLTPLDDENITKNVAILVFEQVEMQDFAGAYEVFGAARNNNNTPAFNTFTVSNDKNPKRCNAGLPPTKGSTGSFFNITPDYSFDDAPDIDVLYIIGGEGIDALLKEEKKKPLFVPWIQKTTGSADYVAGTCSGVMLLASTLLLKNLKVTTHHTRFDQLKAFSNDNKLNLQVFDTRNGENYLHNPNSKFMTSGGVHCGIALALHIVELYQGIDKKEALATNVLEYTIPRGVSHPQSYTPHSVDPEHFVLGFSHLNIIMDSTKMMDEATEFYRKTLGFRESWSVWLSPETCKHFAKDAGFGDIDAKILVRFLVHPNAQFHLELMYYEYPKGEQTITFHKTNDVGGIRHVALEVNNIIDVYDWLSDMDGVKMLSDTPPERLAPDPQTFFYWLDPYGVQWEMEEGRPMARVINGIIG
jgi:inosine-uridine nucleoside N-ribohydrolase/transcriptional regulator GlxA family with amidase domain/catechol 2,3-dioxygenase-like lactoylglutathione lyase family enzyme